MTIEHQARVKREHEISSQHYLDCIFSLKERLASLEARRNPCKGMLQLITECKLEIQECERAAAYHLIGCGYSMIAAGKRLGVEWMTVGEWVVAREKEIQKKQKAERREQEQNNSRSLT